MNKRRRTYIVRFSQHRKPYRISALHDAQAWEIANSLAKSNQWTVASVGSL